MQPTTFPEIDGLTEAEIIALAKRIREEKGESEAGESAGLFSKLMEIRIDAPADFSLQVLKARHGMRM